MTQDQFIRRVQEILHPHSGIKGSDEQKAMIAEAYDIFMTGLEREHAESRTEGLIEFFREQHRVEQENGAQAQYEINHNL